MTSDQATGTAATGAISGGTDDMIESDATPAPQRMAECAAALEGSCVASRGFFEGTRVATRLGWRSVEALAPGDMVLTFDHGFQPVIDLCCEKFLLNDVLAGSRIDPVLLPEGAMGNFGDVVLLPEQGVLIESEAAEDAQGDPFAVVKAEALNGVRGIRRIAPPQKTEVITLIFGHDQVIYAEGGTLLHCPRPTVPLNDLESADISYDIIPDQQSEFVVENMMPVVQHSLPDRPVTHVT